MSVGTKCKKFEHMSGWSWGGNLVYLDIVHGIWSPEGFKDRTRPLPGHELGHTGVGEKHLKELGEVVLEGSGSIFRKRGKGHGSAKAPSFEEVEFWFLSSSKPSTPLVTLEHGDLWRFHCSVLGKSCSLPKLAGFVGCTPPSVHTHCQPARCWTQAGGEVDQVTNFHSDSC